MPEVLPGTVLADRYRLESILGRGGMGAVWRAHHLTLNVPLAIKFIDPELAQGADMMARFTREAQAAAALQGCPNVVQTIDHGVHDGVAFIAMELMQGEDLGSRLHRLGRLPPLETARILGQAGRAIARAHAAGIVHRDLKPDNIFLARDGDDEIAKVLDFGIAKLLDGSSNPGSHTRTGAVLGTPFYMSPEQAEGLALDQRTDIWALGVVACECLTGKRAFDAETLTELVLTICTRPMPIPSSLGAVPPGFDEWFARSCARDLNVRYASVRAQLRDLGELCGLPYVDSARDAELARPITSEPNAITYRARRATTAPVVTPGARELTASSSQRRRKYLAFAGLFMVLTGGGWLVFSNAREQAPAPAGNAELGSSGVVPTPSTELVLNADEPAAATPSAAASHVVESSAVQATSSAARKTAEPQARTPRPTKKVAAPAPAPQAGRPTEARPPNSRVEETDYGF